MSRRFHSVLAVALLASCAGRASGTLLLYDSFNYGPSGTSLGTAGSPTWVKNGSSPDPTVQNVGGLTYPGLQVSNDTKSLQYDGSGVNAGSGAPAATDGTTLASGPYTSGSLYYSLLLKVTAVQTTGGNGFATGINLTQGAYMAGLQTLAATGAPTTTTSAAPLLIRSGDGTQFSSTYQLGTSKTSVAADRQFYASQNFTTGAVAQTVFVVLKYTFDPVGGDSAKLFVNPFPGAPEPGPQLTVTAGTNLSLGSPAGIKSFFVRNNSVEPDTMLIDELRIGTTWQDVTPAGQAPTATPGTLYGTDGSGGNLLTINRITGASSVVGPMFFSAPALAIDPTTGFMYAGQGGGSPNLYLVNPQTAATALVGDTGLGFAAIGDMSFRGDGTLFAAVNIIGDGGSGSDHLAVINKATGLATVIGPFGTIIGGLPTLEGIEAIAFSPSGILYGASTSRGAAGPASTLFIIDPSTGQATPIAAILDAFGNPPSGGITSLQFMSDGTLVGGTARAISPAVDGGFLVTINPLTGQFSFVGTASATGGPSLAAMALVTVPEPSTILSLFVAVIGVLCRQGRKRSLEEAVRIG
jgi:hypothetical protein